MALTADPASLAIILVRIALPILLFWLWHRSKQNQERSDSSYAKEYLLDVRAALQSLEREEDEAPGPLQTLRMANDEFLREKGFQVGTPVARQKSGQKARKASEDTSKAICPPIGDEFAAGLDELDAAGNVPSDLGSSKGGNVVSPTPAPTAPAAFSDARALAARELRSSEQPARQAAAPKASGLGKDGQVQLEAVLNFTAFRHKSRPQRVFLPGEDGPPPPPVPLRLGEASGGESEGLAVVKANTDARTVLKGAMNNSLGLRCKDVAREVNKHLSETGVQPSEPTLILMVEACIHEKDLKGASEFLMKLERAGCTPCEELLDRVMELYVDSRPSSSSAAAAATNPTSAPNGAGLTAMGQVSLRPRSAASPGGDSPAARAATSANAPWRRSSNQTSPLTKASLPAGGFSHDDEEDKHWE